ncbi:MAG: redoxin family protein [Pirellulaceae bacterium]
MNCALNLCSLIVVVVIGLSGCNNNAGNQSDQASNQSERLQEPTGGSGNGGIVEAIQNQSILDAGTEEPIPEDKDELLTFLARKQQEMLREQNPGAQLLLQQQRTEASRALLGMQLGAEQRLQVVRSLLDALLRRASLGDGTARSEFLELASDLRRHPDKGIVDAVAIAGLYHELGNQGGADELNIEPVVQTARGIAEQFPESFSTMRELSTFADGLLRRGEREAWRRIIRELVNIYGNSTDEQVQTWHKTLASRLRIAELNLDVIMNNIRDQKPDAIDQYRSVANQMLGDPDLDVPGMEQLLGSITWLERGQLRDEAMEANRVVLAASLNTTNPDMQERIQEVCELRQTRLSLVGESFEIDGQTARGIPFEWTQYAEGHPLMVVFWSPAEPTSVTSVRSLADTWEKRKEQGLKFLAVNISTSGSSPTRLFGDELPEWEIVISADPPVDGYSKYVSAFGIDQVPHLILVDRNGTISAVNPPVTDVDGQLDRLMQ